MEYKELKSGITEHLNSAAEDFFMVGYFLRQISENALFTEDGYKSIWEFAKGEYNLSTSSASRFMAINARFSVDGGEHMAQQYIGMGVSKLQEMLGLPDEELEKVTQETTVREIRAMKAAAKAPLSYFGFRKTERPADSLITTPGCRNEERGYDCFSCCHDCQIRQELRQCYISTLENPKPCSLMDNEEWQKRIQYSLYKDECQMLHHELAEKRAGDGEPDPCCILCKNKSCFNRCDIAQQRDEAKRPEPSNADIKAFYEYGHFKATDEITADSLKKEYRHSAAGGGKVDYDGSARGVRINRKKELTWVQLRDRLREIQEIEKLKAAEKAMLEDPRKQPDPEPDIIDADFKEVTEDEPEQEPEKAGTDAGGASAEPEAETSGRTEPAAEPDETGEAGAQDVAEPDPEYYDAQDVRNLLKKHEKDLAAYREVEGMPANMMQRERILVDALTLFLAEIERREAEAYED